MSVASAPGPARRIALLGGESSGKTTLARALAEHLGTVWVPEYGRELWIERHGQLQQADLLQIARVQLQREEAALLSARRWLFCDTTPLTTLQYSLELFGQAEAELHRLACRPYDLSLLCVDDIPFEQDGWRRDAAFRHAQQDWTLDQLQQQGVTPVLLRGSLQQRIDTVLEALQGLCDLL